ncbi:hypothetical protein L593_11730 [Salinarchaeum sp. Harcht-Bsk1]|uniref:M24 family metallopeptidase n=1 Tax=Salinarchaeum sp. Harcht-Bsk1 TaxID=1333523 RepID=UPI000342494B|nr:M24 family metallopeptidase [Salinarchaeum sp. Harcht-Bsk1]AGN02289.1 hypothetical protein L593_11730 [Salinarchaeum sp. Harcht-Bsk1]
MPDLDARADRLDAYLDAADLEAVWFARPNGFAWLTGGSNVVDRDGDVGVAAAGYDGEFRVLTDSIEAQRIADEEVPDAFEVERFTWYESDLGAALADRSPSPAAADFDVPGFEALQASELRQPLTDDDVERYRALCADTAEAVEAVCRRLEPTTVEADGATDLTAELRRRGIEAPVALVGGARRAQAYRHYTAREDELGEYALVSVTAQREGLYASTTRTVAFDPPSWLAERTRKAARVEATALAATQAAATGEYPRNADGSGTAGDVFGAIQEAYAAVGYEGEWELHHQGGAAGFAGREWIATPEATDPVHAPMAYSWNPTVQGAKSEDTQLVTANDVEPLTITGDWPTTTVESVELPGVPTVELERHVPL